MKKRYLFPLLLTLLLFRLSAPVLALGSSDALTLYSQGQYDQARAGFLALAQDLSQTSASLAAVNKCLAAQCLFMEKNYDAFTSESQILVADPTLPQPQLAQLQFCQAQVLYGKSLWPQTETALKTAIASNPDPLYAQIASGELAEVLFRENKYSDFQTQASAFLSAYPQAPQAQQNYLRFNLAYLLYMQGKWPDAQTALDQFATNYPQANDALQARYLAIQCLYNMRSFDQFTQRTAAFLAQQPAPTKTQSGWLQYDLAQLSISQGRIGQAGKALFVLLNNAPDSNLRSAALYSLLGCLYQLQRYDEYQAGVKDFLNNYSTGIGVHAIEQLQLNLAMIPVNQGRWQDAKTSLTQFVASYTSPDLVEEARYQTLLCILNLKSYDEFTSQTQAYLQQYPNAPEGQKETLQYFLARTLFDQGHPAQADQAAQNFINSHPNPENTCMAQELRGQSLETEAAQFTQAGNQTQATSATQQAVAQWVASRSDAEQILANTGNVRPLMLVLEHDLAVKAYDRILTETQKLASQYPPSSRPWALGQLFSGMARLNRTPQDLPGAAQSLDAVLSANVADDNLIDHIPTVAAYWRVAVAQMQNDLATAKLNMIKIRDQMPDGPIKANALARFAALLGGNTGTSATLGVANPATTNTVTNNGNTTTPTSGQE